MEKDVSGTVNTRGIFYTSYEKLQTQITKPKTRYVEKHLFAPAQSNL